MKSLWAATLVAMLILSGCERADTTAGAGDNQAGESAALTATATEESKEQLVARAGAPLFDGLGNHHHVITTNDPGAQRYFNQGLVLAFAFNHAEAIRSFRAAQRLDDDCAMCFWGEALATGPNINVTSKGKVIMSTDERVAAYAALQKAVERKDRVSQAERDYIDALAARYHVDPAVERDPLDLAYADAMRALANKYPDDVDASTLFAEALMNTMPWNYWSEKGAPKPATLEVLTMLEAALEKIANGEGVYGAQAHEYKQIARAALQPGDVE